MKYKVGDKVRIKSLDWYNENKNSDDNDSVVFADGWHFSKPMSNFCGKELIIKGISHAVNLPHYIMRDNCFAWTDEMIEGLVEGESLSQEEFAEQWSKFDINEEYNRIINERMKTIKTGTEYFFECPEGYQFKDENGNIINATKIVLEKKKDVDLTQGQINAMVQDSCVSFCKHCGCGVPRETCTSLGTCKEYDEYRAAIRTYLMEKKKKEYPKTIAECKDETVAGSGYKTASLLTQLERLLVCRDAYWKIAGEEMGLRKPWKPDWKDGYQKKYIIYNDSGDIKKGNWFFTNAILAFPTEEMRDAFYENFKDLIEQCKELL